MAELKILIADDEEEARKVILHYLNQELNTFSVYETEDGKSTIEAMNVFKPDILFLDVKMPEASGIQVLENKINLLPAIIFTTAFEQYALPAFDFDAIDYLLKPIEQKRFIKALQKAIQFVQVAKKKAHVTNITVRQGIKTFLVSIDTILFFQSQGKYVEIVTKDKSYLINQSLYELEAALNPIQFIRIHKSTIVNTSFINEIISLLNGDYNLKLMNGDIVRASRTYKKGLKSILNK